MTMTLQEALNKLKPYIGTVNTEFDKQLKYIKDNFTSKSDIGQIDLFIKEELSKTIKNLKTFNKDVSIKMKLAEISNIVSISYIAKTYFNKSRQWFYQRLNGNIVNGKSANFTSEELKTLDFALKDISNKIGSVSIL